jgi:hypothetical protein
MAAISEVNDLACNCSVGPGEARETIDKALVIRDAVRDAVLPIIESALDSLAGQRFETYEENNRLVTRLNEIRTAYSLEFRLVMSSDEEAVPISLRFSEVPGAITGVFKARALSTDRKTIYSRTRMPRLKPVPDRGSAG